MQAEPLRALGAQRRLQPAGEVRSAARSGGRGDSGSGSGSGSGRSSCRAGKRQQGVGSAGTVGRCGAHFSLEMPLWENGAMARRTAARSRARCSAVSVLPLSCPYRGHAGQNGSLPHGAAGFLVLQHGTSSATPSSTSACTMLLGCASELPVGTAAPLAPSRMLACMPLLGASGSRSFHRPHAQHPISGCLLTAPAAHGACSLTISNGYSHSFCS